MGGCGWHLPHKTSLSLLGHVGGNNLHFSSFKRWASSPDLLGSARFEPLFEYICLIRHVCFERVPWALPLGRSTQALAHCAKTWLTLIVGTLACKTEGQQVLRSSAKFFGFWTLSSFCLRFCVFVWLWLSSLKIWRHIWSLTTEIPTPISSQG